MISAPTADDIKRARLLLVLLCLGWGVTWPVMKVSLNEIPPLSFRTGTAAIGAFVVCTIALVRQGSLYVPRSTWIHIILSGLMNIVGFSLFSAFAQLSATTSRV